MPCTLHLASCIPCTLHPSPCTPCTLHPLHPTPPAPYTPCTLHPRTHQHLAQYNFETSRQTRRVRALAASSPSSARRRTIPSRRQRKANRAMRACRSRPGWRPRRPYHHPRPWHRLQVSTQAASTPPLRRKPRHLVLALQPCFPHSLARCTQLLLSQSWGRDHPERAPLCLLPPSPTASPA